MLLIKTNWLSFICSRAFIRTNVIKQMEMLCFHLYVFFYPVIFRETPEKWKEFSLIMLDNLLHEFGWFTSLFTAQFLCLQVTSKALFCVKIILFHKVDHQTLERWSLTQRNKFPKLKEKKSTLWPWKMLHFILCILFRHWYFLAQDFLWFASHLKKKVIMEIQMHKFNLALTAIMELKFSLPSSNVTINNLLFVTLWLMV